MRKRRLVELLESAHEAAKMERAAFNSIAGNPESPLPKAEAEVTEFIRKRTRIYRQSWILSPLKEALEILNGSK